LPTHLVRAFVSVAALSVGWALALSAVRAQSPQPVPRAAVVFEVTSAKPNRSPDTMMAMRTTPNGFVATNTPLVFIIMQAYEVKSDSIHDEPGWVHQERFDIEGKVADGHVAEYSRDAALRRAALRALLADRFALRAREVQADAQGYALVLARDDGRLGPALRRSTLVCSKESPARLDDGRKSECFTSNDEVGLIRGRGASVAELASLLRLTVGAIVTDRTGLTGAYDYDLAFLPDARRLSASPVSPEVQNRASLFTALNEQLGLRLQPERVGQKALIVEGVARPRAN
jgi:uncharacterized protein (TIGR03435 family)